MVIPPNQQRKRSRFRWRPRVANGSLIGRDLRREGRTLPQHVVTVISRQAIWCAISWWGRPPTTQGKEAVTLPGSRPGKNLWNPSNDRQGILSYFPDDSRMGNQSVHLIGDGGICAQRLWRSLRSTCFSIHYKAPRSFYSATTARSQSIFRSPSFSPWVGQRKPPSSNSFQA